MHIPAAWLCKSVVMVLVMVLAFVVQAKDIIK